MKRLALFLAFFAYVGIYLAMAQTVQITGTIVSSEDGQPLPGASITVKGTNVGTTTDFQGKYSLSVPADAKTLIINFVGLKSQEIEIGGKSIINASMEPDTKTLNEVVVTALGITREKRALGYAVQDVDGEEITKARNSNLAVALQGKVAGVDIKPSSGMPGASSQITIRGARSFTDNNSPLYVIDGMPIASIADYDVGGYGVTGPDISNRAIDINPADIETLNVLKGQAAAALYGIRASNGVIIITTKSGSKNKLGKPVITFSHTSNFDKVSRNPDFQTTYAQGSDGEFATPTSLSWGPKIVDLPDDAVYGGNNNGHPGLYRVPQLESAGLDPWVKPQIYNNWKDFFKTGYATTNNIAISQANESGNYSFGITNTNQDGIAPATGMNRWNVKGLFDRKINNNFKVGFNANYSKTEIDKLAGANDSELSGVYAAPSSYNLKGIPSSLPTDPYTQISYRSTASYDNPYWAVKNNSFNEITDRFFGNGHINYTARLRGTMNLNINYQLGNDYYTTHFQDIFGYGHSNKTGSVTNYGVTSSTYNSLLTATYDWNISNDLQFTLLVGNELDNKNTKYYTENGIGFNYGGWNHIDNANTVTASESHYESRTVGVFGDMSLSWKSMLYFNATGRNDVVSTMPRNNRSFFYPSVSLGFVASELGVIKEINWISYAKLRGSYAEVGQAGQYYADFYTKPNYEGGFWNDVPINYPLGGVNAYIPNNVKYDPNLKPQNTKSYEIGLELKFFKNRLGVDYTYSRQNVSDQIFQVPLAASSGASKMYMNGGELHTNANEVVFYGTPIKTRDFQWDLKVNYYKVKNVVDELATGVESIFLGGFDVPQVRAGIGYTYPVIYGSSYLRDKSGNIVVDDDPNSNTYGMPQVGADAVIGKVTPDFILGGSSTFTYKTLSLDAVFEWKNGGKMYSGSNGLLDYYGMSARTKDRESTFIIKGVKSDGTPNDIARGGSSDPLAMQVLHTQVLTNIDEYYVRDNSFVKLRELSLHYKHPKKVFNSFEVTASVFARNILVWTKLENFDPESSQGNNNMGGSFERLSVPQTTSYGFGLDFTF
jgi:TonB-linked SusC/RagA family outer membrane protein